MNPRGSVGVCKNSGGCSPDRFWVMNSFLNVLYRKPALKPHRKKTIFFYLIDTSFWWLRRVRVIFWSSGHLSFSSFWCDISRCFVNDIHYRAIYIYNFFLTDRFDSSDGLNEFHTNVFLARLKKRVHANT